VRELFDAVLDQPAELRREFLARACDGDQQLLETVGRLLQAQERSDGILDTPVRQRREVTASVREPGSYIGPYKIIQQLGGGGMGIVYQAVRADEVFQRVCAVKVIREELSTDWLVQRFSQERQILAGLDHGNIARIVDGGSTAEKLPYFVMDYVDGPPITTFCTEHELGPKARLALLQQVCAAVHYLHQHSVIHADLKPPNILVGADGSAKLVDFGIARALSAQQQQPLDKTFMTTGYASPEQLRGERLTPASDVYSLGVILYELLTGTRPYPTPDRSRGEILNDIGNHDPVLPSAKISGQARNDLKGDVDCIVLQAMHRNPAQRYQSAAELRSDIGRYLECRPVRARKGTVFYGSRKFIGRHSGMVVASLVAAILLATTCWEGAVAYRRALYAHQLEDKLREKQNDLGERANQRRLEFQQSGTGKDLPLAKKLQESELQDVKELTDAYRTSFPEAVHVWPGMTPSRRALLDQADQYLRAVERYVGQDPQSREQLANAWLWLANIEGNPQTVNLHDRSGALSSINEAQDLLQKSSGASAGLVEQVNTAARQIEAGK